MAGLWPFYVPTNDVTWLRRMDGIEFGHYGTAVSSGPFQGGERTDAAGTLEIWLRAASTRRIGTILSFDGSAHPGEPFSLHQEEGALSIRRNNGDSHTALFHVGGVFQEKSPVFVTVTLDPQETSVYVNGIVAKAFPHSRAGNDLTGRLVLANSPSANSSWSGDIFGLALYRQKLTASQIAADYSSWMKRENSIPATERTAAAMYLFDEHGGAVVHNRLDPATDLMIPARYFVLHPGFLRVPWREYRPTSDYWLDVGVNVAGFVPFGFCVFAYFSLIRVIKYSEATTIFLGLLTSLMIEIVQAFLPTRSSGMTDLITNTVGTAIGVIISRHFIAQMLIPNAKDTSKTNSSQAMGPASRITVSDVTTSASA